MLNDEEGHGKPPVGEVARGSRGDEVRAASRRSGREGGALRPRDSRSGPIVSKSPSQADSRHRLYRTGRQSPRDTKPAGHVEALLRVFGSTKRIREATVEQIAAVPGISPALAARIKTALEA
jgi:hypothetical protein